MSGIIIKPRSRIFHGHDWVYSSEVKKVFGNPEPGAIISLVDFKDRSLGTAIYNPASQIIARRFSLRKQELDLAFFQRRLARAQAFREKLGFREPVYRMVWSEADRLPGVIVDRYGDHFVLQTLTLGMDQRKELIAKVLMEQHGARSVVERNDSPIRKAEGLEEQTGILAGEWSGPFDITVNGLIQEVDLVNGQKTGIYLDQLDNYAAVARHAPGKSVLDCFCNQGGFALHAAKAGASSVLAIDSSEGAIEATQRNAARNELQVDTEVANVFDFLKQAEQQERKFEVIILDPPSFSKGKKSVEGAMRGYKEIHLRALKLLQPGGILSTYSCSHHISESEFLRVIADASVDARRTLVTLERHTQRLDHPVVVTLPETHYLKGFTFQVVGGY